MTGSHIPDTGDRKTTTTTTATQASVVHFMRTK